MNDPRTIESPRGPSYEAEYKECMSYVQHMYDTRHHIFQFIVGLNTALFAGLSQVAHTAHEKLAVCVLGFVVTVTMALMARRSSTYLRTLEAYTKEVEAKVGFGMLTTTTSRMPRGLDSTKYLFVVYWSIVCAWVVALVQLAVHAGSLSTFLSS
jgi:hypothetical protein